MITIYGRANCPWCDKAKQLATDNQLQYQYIDYVKEGLTADELRAIAKHDVKTVPVVLVKGKYIGGYEELAKFTHK